jgi:Nucleotide-diphospho-sugar transferase
VADAGVVLVATGAETYIALAARAAASVKRHCPGLAVDLFTDQARELPVFDRIHRLPDPWFRSKIDGLMASRFQRTLYMDADMLALADFRDVFELLERFDVALAHDWFRNSPLHHTFWRKPLPAAFPQFNGGLIAIRRTPATTAFLEAWKAAVRSTDTGRDQISLRELLWESELRIATLPEEYNLLWISGVKSWTTDFAAPRIIHSPHFHRDFARYARASDPAAERMGLIAAARLPLLIAADRGLARLRNAPPRPPGPADRRAVLGRILAGLPRTLVGRLRRALARLRS